MKRIDAFNNMRKQRADRLRREQNAEWARRDAAFRQQQEEWKAQEAKWAEEDREREFKASMDRIMYQAGMSAWGVDLTACLFNPKPLPVPAPPVYGGEPYKMMKIPREAT